MIKKLILFLLKRTKINSKFIEDILNISYKDSNNALTEKFKDRIITTIS